MEKFHSTPAQIDPKVTILKSTPDEDPLVFYSFRVLQIREDLIRGDIEGACELYQDLQQHLPSDRYPGFYSTFFVKLEEGGATPDQIQLLVTSQKNLPLSKPADSSKKEEKGASSNTVVHTRSKPPIHPFELATSAEGPRSITVENVLLSAIHTGLNTFGSHLKQLVNSGAISYRDAVSLPSIQKETKKHLLHSLNTGLNSFSSTLNQVVNLEIYTHLEVVNDSEIKDIARTYLINSLDSGLNTFSQTLSQIVNLQLFSYQEAISLPEIRILAKQYLLNALQSGPNTLTKVQSQISNLQIMSYPEMEDFLNGR